MGLFRIKDPEIGMPLLKQIAGIASAIEGVEVWEAFVDEGSDLVYLSERFDSEEAYLRYESAVDAQGLRPEVGEAFELEHLLLLSPLGNERLRADLDALEPWKSTRSQLLIRLNRCRSPDQPTRPVGSPTVCDVIHNVSDPPLIAEIRVIPAETTAPPTWKKTGKPVSQIRKLPPPIKVTVAIRTVPEHNRRPYTVNVPPIRTPSDVVPKWVRSVVTRSSHRREE